MDGLQASGVKIPDVLMEYLRRLAEEDGEEECRFALSGRELGGGTVQDISGCGGSVRRTVFGFDPVWGTVLLRRKETGWILAAMSFAAPEQSGGREAVCPA